MFHKIIKNTLLIGLFLGLSNLAHAALPVKKMLTAETAQEMVKAAIQKADELKIKISVAILDDAGNLKYFVRMDGATAGSIEISQLKASTSAKLPISSRELADRNLKNENRPYHKFPFAIPLAGGLPIKTKAGEHIGGIGVSGATADQDELCAQAGLDKVKEALN